MPRITITPQFEVGDVVYLRNGGEDADACIVIAILVLEDRRLLYMLRWPNASKSCHSGGELTDNFDDVLALRWQRGPATDQGGDDEHGDQD